MAMTQHNDTVMAVARAGGTVTAMRSEQGAVTSGRRRMDLAQSDVSIPQNACCTQSVRTHYMKNVPTVLRGG